MATGFGNVPVRPGGRFEPIGDDFHNSSIRIVTGPEQIPGLKKG